MDFRGAPKRTKDNRPAHQGQGRLSIQRFFLLEAGGLCGVELRQSDQPWLNPVGRRLHVFPHVPQDVNHRRYLVKRLFTLKS